MPPICMPTKERPVQVVWGDCLRVMSTLPPGCVDTIITDPPYHLTQASRGGSPRTPGTGPFGRVHLGERGFMGKTWDGGDIAFRPEVWAECLRVAKPGAFLLAFGGTRTWHRLACAVEDAGWEIRDTLCWLYGTGFPKAKSCLKPSWEPVILALKLAQRVPPLNIDAARVPTPDDRARPPRAANGIYGNGHGTNLTASDSHPSGRWPANTVLSHHESCECRGTKRVKGSNGIRRSDTGNMMFGGGKGLNCPTAGQEVGYADADGMEDVEDWTCHQECPVRLLDEQAGEVSYNPGGVFANDQPAGWSGGANNIGRHGSATRSVFGYGDRGGPSRFFYCSKTNKRERGEGNNHATVKPLALMRWLVKLVSFPGNLILDPFAGSGTTGLAAAHEGRRCLLVEKEQPSVKIIRSRLASMAPEVTSNGADNGR